MVSLTRFLRVVEAVVEATVMAMASCVSETSGRALFVSLMLFGLDGHGVSCTDLLFRAAALRCWRCGCCCGCGCGAVETETEAVVEFDSDCFAALLYRKRRVRISTSVSMARDSDVYRRALRTCE